MTAFLVWAQSAASSRVLFWRVIFHLLEQTTQLILTYSYWYFIYIFIWYIWFKSSLQGIYFVFLICLFFFMLLVHRLSAIILKDSELALRASILFCLNPASIFYSAMYFLLPCLAFASYYDDLHMSMFCPVCSQIYWKYVCFVFHWRNVLSHEGFN